MPRDALTEAISELALGRHLSYEQTKGAFLRIILGLAGEAQISSFLTELKILGETASELAGAVGAILNAMVGWPSTAANGLGSRIEGLIDTCGTGGDGATTVNVSTATAIVVAAAGGKVAKHGNRSASGNSSSADVLAELGLAIEASPTTARRCLETLGITFLYAPLYHPALRHAASVRRQLPFGTIFNLVGPLVNPARPDYQLIGVSGAEHLALIAECLARLDSTKRAAVIRGRDGLDEVSLAVVTDVLWVEAGQIRKEIWTPRDFGLKSALLSELRVGGPVESADRIRAVLAGSGDAIRRFVLANSAAALLVAGLTRSLAAGVDRAADAIDSGKASTLLEQWVELSRRDPLPHRAED